MILWEEIMFRSVVGVKGLRFSCYQFPDDKIRGLATRIFDHISIKILPVGSPSLFEVLWSCPFLQTITSTMIVTTITTVTANTQIAIKSAFWSCWSWTSFVDHTYGELLVPFSDVPCEGVLSTPVDGNFGWLLFILIELLEAVVVTSWASLLYGVSVVSLPLVSSLTVFVECVEIAVDISDSGSSTQSSNVLSKSYPLGHVFPHSRFWLIVHSWITFLTPQSWHVLQCPFPWSSE